MKTRSKQANAKVKKYTLWTAFIIVIIYAIAVDKFYSSKDKSKDIQEATTVRRFEVDESVYYYPLD